MADDWYDHAGDAVSEARWDKWNGYAPLPEPGVSRPFDNFLAEKGLTRDDLARIGTRWVPQAQGGGALAYLFPDGIKYRTLDGRRWAEDDVSWQSGKKVSLTPNAPPPTVVIAEGETDGAAILSQGAARPSAGSDDRAHDADPGDAKTRQVLGLGGEGGWDVIILPAGAKHIPANLKAQCEPYARVLVALDNDPPGEEGANALLELLPNARRVLPPVGHKDWGAALAADPTLLDTSGWAPFEVRPPRRVFSVREVIAADLGTYAENNWFDGDICPIGGEVIIHGPIKSLKSVVATDLAVGITTGTAFAGYLDFCRPEGPGRVLMIQFEIPPRGFQQRLNGVLKTIPVAQRDLFLDNFMVYGVADRSRPRLKMQDKGFVASIRRAVEEAEADVVMFDPMQRMTGGANADKAHEMEPILDVFSQLQDAGLTVVYTHHDTKSGGNDTAAYNMSGSQRFGADADSICSLIYDPKVMIEDDNPGGIKQRNFVWTLRAGATQGRSITASPDLTDPEFMHVTYDVPVTAAPAVTSGVTSSASATGTALGMPSIK